MVEDILRAKLTDDNYEKLMALPNPTLHRFVAEAIQLCRPDSVYVCADSEDDAVYIRDMAVRSGEEAPLATAGHTIRCDGYQDQARDKENTRYLLRPGVDLGANLNSMDWETGVAEVKGFLKDSMAGKQMLVRFFCLGPRQSVFSISGVQLTDSFYVAHSEDLLYRSGYEQFKRIGDGAGFFKVLHSAGRLENHASADVDKRRVYIDLDENTVYSVNTQYAGNTVGFKKLSLRLAITTADRDGWLAEHMFVMAVHGPNGRATYFTGAFPSACGKTSTAMMEGETIVGDDLSYLRVVHGEVRAVNVECGIFGIIRDVNAKDDPVIWEQLTRPGEVIFSNVLVADGKPYWTGSGVEMPDHGVNFSGKWEKGKKDADGNDIPGAHPNSRYTIRLAGLRNLDARAEDPDGVTVGGIVYGGRDSDTWPPVQQSFDWAHGVLTMGACLESETTSATLGQEGVRKFQPMSNLDFVSVPLGKYIRNYLDFVKGLAKPPVIFASNYFMRGPDGKYLTGMNDKRVWLKWAELRVHDDVDAVKTPTGQIPQYDDLKRLFREVLDQDYAEEQYVEQFALRIPENLRKIERMRKTWAKVTDTPRELFDALSAQRDRLLALQEKRGDCVSPAALAEES